MKKLILFLLVPAIIFLLLPPGLAATGTNTSLSGLQIYPKDYIWNVPVDALPVDARSSAYVNSGNPSAFMYLDKDMPYNVVNSTQPKQRLTSVTYPVYSDNIPYPIPDAPLIENNRDRHLLIVNPEENKLYEMYHANQSPGGTWSAGVAVVYDLSDYALRPDHTVSADAAGLPILSGIIRYEEVDSGTINHALRFATNTLQNTYIWPARAAAGSTDSDPSNPPHGQRFRLNSSFNTSAYPPQEKIVLRALKTYGMILADYNGGDPTVFSIYAAPDERWAINFTSFKDITLTDFEAVDESSLMINKDSGQARVAQPGSGNLSLEVWIIAVACTIILTISYGRIILKKRSRQALANRKTSASAKKTVHHEPAKPFITEETVPAVPAEKRGTKKGTGSPALPDLKTAVKKTVRHFTKQPRITGETVPAVPAEKRGTKKGTGSPALPDLKTAVKKTARHFTKQPRITEETVPAVPAEKRDEKMSAGPPVSRPRVVVDEDHATLTLPPPSQPDPTSEDGRLHGPAENKKISHDQEPPADAIRRVPKNTGSEKEETNDTPAELSRSTSGKEKNTYENK
ncbi:MAG: hypothetical protein M0Q91_13655 [Methanoregula sp.]|nr:hypothetical protein [Methanoregula sp.]